MDQRPLLLLENLRHRDEIHIAMRFEKSSALSTAVKSLTGVKFSKTHGCWYMPRNRESFNSIIERLQLIAQIDYTTLKKTAHPAQMRRQEPTVARKCPAEYTEQLQRMRYSENTVRTYTGLFVQFINYFSQTEIDVLSDEQVNEFMHAMASLRGRPAKKRADWYAGERCGFKTDGTYIVGGKGKKDRITLLSQKMLDLLRLYFKEYRPEKWLFEGEAGKPYPASSLQKISGTALHKSGVRKEATLHTLRHSFATHLLEAGTSGIYRHCRVIVQVRLTRFIHM